MKSYTHLSRYSQQVYLSIILAIAGFLLLWHRGSINIYEWDEARNGVNAYEMFFNHDYFNLYYGSEPDTISSKPPLLIWLMTISHALFGFNEFALRFPSLITTVLFFIVLYKLLNIYTSPFKAFITCMILITCRAIIDNHVGLTGDFDAPLLLFITLSVYYFSRYTEHDKVYALYMAALFTGIAFYAKGTAAFLYLPGFFFYLILKGKLKQLLTNKHTYAALLILVLIVSSWIYIAVNYTAYPEQSETMYGSRNSIETMLVHETFNRITSSNFSDYETADPFFFIHTIEWRMNTWHILFYLSVVIGIFRLYKSRAKLKTLMDNPEHRLTVLGLCLSIPIIILVNFAANTLNWYFAPTWPYIAYITVMGIAYICRKWQPAVLIFAVIFAFNLVKHFLYLHHLPTDMHEVMQNEKSFFKDDKPVVLFTRPKDDILLYVSWLHKGFVLYDNEADLTTLTGRQGVIPLDLLTKYEDKVEVKKQFGKYCTVILR